MNGPENKLQVSAYVRQQLPSFIREDDSLFIDFLVAYYEWMETEGNTIHETGNLLSYLDIDTTVAKFFDYFRGQYMKNIPKELQADFPNVLKHIVQFYRSRGSENSFKFFIRAVFGADAEILYPKEDILRVSGGYWIKQKVLKITSNDPAAANLAGKRIKGKSSFATAVVSSALQYFSGPNLIIELELSSVRGQFFKDEIIETNDGQPIKIRGFVSGQIVAATIITPGTGYSLGQTIPITNHNGGYDFFAKVSSIDTNGGITGVEIFNQGSQYVQAPVTDLTMVGDGNAVVTFTVGGLYTSNGRYYDSRSLISSHSVIQDGRQYQEYSYIIKTVVDFAKYASYIKKILHPAGMFLAGLRVINMPDDGSAVDARMFHLSHPDDVNYKDPDNESSRKFFEPLIILAPVVEDEMQVTVPGNGVGNMFFNLVPFIQMPYVGIDLLPMNYAPEEIPGYGAEMPVWYFVNRHMRVREFYSLQQILETSAASQHSQETIVTVDDNDIGDIDSIDDEIGPWYDEYIGSVAKELLVAPIQSYYLINGEPEVPGEDPDPEPEPENEFARFGEDSEERETEDSELRETEEL